MGFRWDKKDKYGQVIKPGDMCMVAGKDGIKFCLYKHEVKRSTKGEYGRFITKSGVVTLKFTGVVFVFDPITDRRGRTEETTELTRRFYEDIR